jgi:hypothetical protein
MHRNRSCCIGSCALVANDSSRSELWGRAAGTDQQPPECESSDQRTEHTLCRAIIGRTKAVWKMGYIKEVGQQLVLLISPFTMLITTETTEAESSFVLCAEIQDSHRSNNESFVLNPAGYFSFEKRLIPQFRSPRDVRVRIVATGLCGSDACELFSLDTYHAD